MKEKISLPPKIIKGSDVDLTVVHSVVELEDAVKVDFYSDGNTFSVVILTDLDFKLFKFIPMGKVMKLFLGNIEIWSKEIDNYVLVDSITKERKDNMYVIEGKLFAFSENLE